MTTRTFILIIASVSAAVWAALAPFVAALEAAQ